MEQHGNLEKRKALTIPCVIFKLSRNVFALPISQIKEITPSNEITPVPNAPDEILGIIDLRGKMIPVVDLKKILYRHSVNSYIPTNNSDEPKQAPKSDEEKTGKHSFKQNSNTLIVDFAKSSEQVIAGLLVDEVMEVFYLSTDNIELSSPITMRQSGASVVGIFRHKSAAVMLIDCRKVFTNEIFAELIDN